MIITKQNIDTCSIEELEHRRSFLKRNWALYEQTGLQSLIEKRQEELDAIESELFFRGA